MTKNEPQPATDSEPLLDISKFWGTLGYAILEDNPNAIVHRSEDGVHYWIKENDQTTTS